MTGFNPRTRMGCDCTATPQSTSFAVSIHAPAWGATSDNSERVKRVSLFQSTHPHGVRPLRPFLILFSVLFQSTHPHGVRQEWCRDQAYHIQVSIHAPAWGATALMLKRSVSSISFNPRTRMGCDGSTGEVLHTEIVSIHAPAWGATVYSAMS